MGKRIVAGLIDLGIAGIASVLFMSLASTIFGREFLYYSIIIPVGYFFYMTIMELANDGKTAGRVAMKIYVHGKNGKAPSSVDYIVRNIVKTMPVLIVVLFPKIWIGTLIIAGIYFMVPLVHSKKLAIHDLVGATIVCAVEPEETKVFAVEADVPVKEAPQVKQEVKQEVRQEAKPEIETKPEIKPENKVMYGLYCMSGMYKGMFVPLTRDVVMGRAFNCNLVFKEDTPRISRSHCIVTCNEKDGIVMVTDLNSSYGTYLDKDVRIPAGKPVVLKVGEEFLIGVNERFRVEIKS